MQSLHLRTNQPEFLLKVNRYILPKNPDTVLTTSSVSMFGLSAVGTCKIANTEKQTRYNLLRPKVSDSGARIRGPIPKRTRNPVVAPTTALGEVLRSAAICSMPGVNMELARGLRTVIVSLAD